MESALQLSLLDAGESLGLADLVAGVRRVALGQGAWVDHVRGWVRGSDELFDRLQGVVPWYAEKRQMYERVVDVPRLLCFYDDGAPLPDPLLVEAKAALDAHYRHDLGESFSTVGLCLYRDGRDSVAWHGDTIGRGKTEDTAVAILSLGAPRSLLLRPRGEGETRRYPLGHGDLLVMGGSCQRTWEHCIPKTARTVGPRISIQFRPRDVR
ncbi:MAG TPA: alpha-ketoglutarate-dependent dioxygenase AlkB [Actinopolymorphaceae bacterium]|nr:alpha-ketoglutarate-dependent dioxygenase AlkB [Actinopolymorphaceae bacterium]